jgi:hypothetical protein
MEELQVTLGVKSFKLPLVYVPGDNEWADCHKKKEGGGLYNAVTSVIDYVTTDGGSYAKGDPLANLSLVRSIFFPTTGQSLGANPIAVHSQKNEYDTAHPADAQFVENVWFEKNGVLFMTLNVPGGSNNDTDPWYVTSTITNAQDKWPPVRPPICAGSIRHLPKPRPTKTLPWSFKFRPICGTKMV